MKIQISLTLVCCLAGNTCATFAAVQPKARLAQILAKSALAEGASASKHRSSRTEYIVSAGMLSGTMVEYVRPPFCSRSDLNLGPIAIIQADNGKTQWEQDPTGNVRVMHGEELAENRAAEMYSVASLTEKGKAQHASLRPNTDPKDYIVDNVLSTNSNITIWINKQTYLTDKIVMHKAGIAATVLFRHYKKLHGVAVPDVIDMEYAGLPLAVHMQLSKYDDKTIPSLTLFSPPATLVSDTSASGNAPTVLPFTLSHNEIVLNAALDGSDMKVILDSGAGTSFVTADIAERLKLKSQADLPAQGYGGAAKVSIATKATITLGSSITLRNQLVYIMPPGPSTTSFKASIGADGVLGYDLLARYVTKINYDKETVTFYRPGTYDPSAESIAVSLPITLQLRAPLISATIDGHAGRFLVDTGDSGSVHLYNAFSRKFGFDTAPGGVVSKGQGIGGGIVESTTAGHKLNLGVITLADVAAATITGSGVSSFSELAGGIGNDVLRNLNPTFDYPRGQIYFDSPNPKPTPSKADAASLSEVLDRHATALGGREAISLIRTTRVEASITTGNVKGHVTSRYSSPDQEEETDQLGFIRTRQGFTGKSGWKQGENGAIRDLSEGELRDIRTQVYFDSNSYLRKDYNPADVYLLPNQGPNGEYLVRISPPNCRPSTIAIDAKTFLIAYEVHSDDAGLVTTRFSDYRRVNGVSFPFRQHVSNGQPRYDIDVVVESVTNNAPIPAAVFDRPIVKSAVQLMAPHKRFATLHFSIQNGFILLPCVIEGKARNLILDTGAAGIALTKNFVTAAKLKTSGVLEARGYGGSTDYEPTFIHTLKLGNAATMTDVTAGTVSLPAALSDYLPSDVVGFIGYDLLSRFVVTINMHSHTITMMEPDYFKPSKDQMQAKSHLIIDRDEPSIEGSVNGIPNVRLLIDTGDSATLRLYSKFARNHKIMPSLNSATVYGGGIGGVATAQTGTIGKLLVGGQSILNVPTEFSNESSNGTSDVLAGAIGVGFVQGSVFTVDYPHSAIYFGKLATIHPTRDIGLQLDKDKYRGRSVLIISGISAQLAKRTLLRVTQRVERINGARVQAIYAPKYTAMLQKWPEQRPLRLTVRDGSNRTQTVNLNP